MKPFSTYPEDRERLLTLARIVENPDAVDEDTYRSKAIELGDLVRAILEDEAVAIETQESEEGGSPPSAA